MLMGGLFVCMDGLDGNARVRIAVETEDRRLHLGNLVDRATHHTGHGASVYGATIVDDAGLYGGDARGREERLPATHTEADNANLAPLGVQGVDDRGQILQRTPLI